MQTPDHETNDLLVIENLLTHGNKIVMQNKTAGQWVIVCLYHKIND